MNISRPKNTEPPIHHDALKNNDPHVCSKIVHRTFRAVNYFTRILLLDIVVSKLIWKQAKSNETFCDHWLNKVGAGGGVYVLILVIQVGVNVIYDYLLAIYNPVTIDEK